MGLATVALVKARLGMSGSADDTELGTILRGVEDAIARACGRVVDGEPCLVGPQAVVEYLSPQPGNRVLYLAGRPVVSITECKEAVYGAFDDADAMAENTDYQLLAIYGKLLRIGTWLAGDLTVRVTYTAGYTYALPWVTGEAYTTGDVVASGGGVYTCSSSIDPSATAPGSDADHWTLATGQRPLPYELTEAAILQASYAWQRRGSPGLRGEGGQGGSITWTEGDGLLPAVRKLCGRYARRMG
ncbi:MAG TPA: hypothetical protein VMZ50_09205 [Phycisphaerae bacterium]|nr:hypothetical protein [Phycisphaerae bacterium]